MVKQSAAMPLAVPLVAGLDRSSAVPLHRQLYDRLREAILTGWLSGGTRLPATRTLALELGLSRNTVMNAFDQLLAEGYIEGRVGDGTYVSHVLPDEALYMAPTQTRTEQRARHAVLRACLTTLTKGGKIG